MHMLKKIFKSIIATQFIFLLFSCSSGKKMQNNKNISSEKNSTENVKQYFNEKPGCIESIIIPFDKQCYDYNTWYRIVQNVDNGDGSLAQSCVDKHHCTKEITTYLSHAGVKYKEGEIVNIVPEKDKKCWFYDGDYILKTGQKQDKLIKLKLITEIECRKEVMIGEPKEYGGETIIRCYKKSTK